MAEHTNTCIYSQINVNTQINEAEKMTQSLRTLVFIEFALNRGPRLCSQCPPGGSQTSITQVPGSPISSSALDIKHTHFYAVKTFMHVIIIFKKQFRKLIEILNSQLYLGLYFRL